MTLKFPDNPTEEDADEWVRLTSCPTCNKHFQFPPAAKCCRHCKAVVPDKVLLNVGYEERGSYIEYIQGEGNVLHEHCLVHEAEVHDKAEYARRSAELSQYGDYIIKSRGTPLIAPYIVEVRKGEAYYNAGTDRQRVAEDHKRSLELIEDLSKQELARKREAEYTAFRRKYYIYYRALDALVASFWITVLWVLL